MNSPPDEYGTLAPSLAKEIDSVCERFEGAWKAGERPRLEDFLVGPLSPGAVANLLRELILLDLSFRCQRGETPDTADYRSRFPELDLAWLQEAARAAAAPPAEEPQPPGPRAAARQAAARQAHQIRCPHCQSPIRLIDDRPDEILCPGCGSSFRIHEARQTNTTEPMRLLGKFQLLERIGLGAFGAVWRARDTELGRIVALKILHTGLVSSAGDLARFFGEARSAAQFRHPNIVTVHEVATLEGMPAIVSDFIDGAPLKELLEVRRLTCRESAALVAEVADALDHAHNQGKGVVHRDVKPANIMVEYGQRTGEEEGGNAELKDVGRPLVVDFGLALRGEAEVVMTLDGYIIGTPAYMSPEQAAGKGHEADRRSDVYSLGVVLYELLTGVLPFRGSVKMLLQQVRHDEPQPLRRINDRVPRDLETVCLKALAKEPERRYQTAAELARELRRYLKGEPVLARPVGKVERLWRWCRRNPRVAALAGTVLSLLIALAAGSTVAAILIERGRRAAVRAEKQAEEERGRAERHFQAARHAMKELVQAVRHRLDDVPRMEMWQKRLLKETVLPFYKKLARAESSRPQLRREQANAYREMGEIYTLLGEKKAARDAYGQAILLLTELAREDPGEAAYRHELATTHTDLGELLRTGQLQPREAEKNYGKALELEERLVKEASEKLPYLLELARAHNNRGILLQKIKGREGEAKRDYDRAIWLLGEGGSGTSPRLRADLARGYLERATWHAARGNYREAKRDCQEAIDRLATLVRDSMGRRREYRYRLGIAYNNLSNILEKSREPDAARQRRAAQSAALDCLRQLHKDFPMVPRYREILANSLNSLGNVQADAGWPDKAETSYREAHRLFKGLLKDFPRYPEYQCRLGITRSNLGFLRLEEVIRWNASQRLFPTWLMPGRQRLVEADALFKEAITTQEEALSAAPRNPEFANELRMSLGRQAETLIRLGDRDRAATAARKMIRVLPEGGQKYRSAASILARCVPLAKNDRRLTPEKRRVEAEAYAVEAVGLLRTAVTRKLFERRRLKRGRIYRLLGSRPDFRQLLQE